MNINAVLKALGKGFISAALCSFALFLTVPRILAFRVEDKELFWEALFTIKSMLHQKAVMLAMIGPLLLFFYYFRQKQVKQAQGVIGFTFLMCIYLFALL